MKTWLKHTKDKIEVFRFAHKGVKVKITTGSRHGTMGEKLGYIVHLSDSDGLNQKTFKHYHHREAVEVLTEALYKMGVPI